MKAKTILPLVLILSGCGANDSGGILASSSGLSGSWISDCQEFTDQYNEGSFVGSFTWEEEFYSDEIDSSMRIYDDENCQGNPIITKKMMGSFDLGDKFTDESGVEGQKINFHYESESVVGSHPNIDTVNLGMPTPSIYLDIFYIGGTNLYYGDYLTGSGISERPTRLDLEYPYRKR